MPAFQLAIMFRRSVKTLLLGPPRCGKTALHRALTGVVAGPTRTYSPTEGVGYGCCIVDGVKLHLWDVGGDGRYRTLTRPYVNDASALLAVYDARDPAAAEDTLRRLATEWLGREEVAACHPEMVYVVGVTAAPTTRGGHTAPDPPEVRRQLALTVQAFRRTFPGAQVVVPLHVALHKPGGAHSLAIRLAQDAVLLSAGVLHQVSSPQPRRRRTSMTISSTPNRCPCTPGKCCTIM